MEFQCLKAKKVLVLGLGISGRSAARFLLSRQSIVVGIDRDAQLKEKNHELLELCQQGLIFIPEIEFLEETLSEFDLVIVSPGIPKTQFIYRKAKACGIEVIGEVELACREMKQRCLAITGTNGKTTVTLLTTHILNSCGIKSKALGNVGTPLTSIINFGDQDIDVYVLELSSFQLDTLNSCFIDAAVVLNITPDHLDRYSSMIDYAASKMGIEKNLKPEGIFFLESRCFNEYHALIQEKVPVTFGDSLKNGFYFEDGCIYCNGQKILTLPKCYREKYTHEVENILASYALCSTLSIKPEDFLRSLNSFQKLSHRIEFIRNHAGVNYYDDSKGTNIDAVIRAVEIMEGQVILIAGGVDKGFPYTSWITVFNKKVKAICAIGESKEKIKKDLEHHIPVFLFVDLEKAVKHAAELASPGENVLLSPGCSSFDMFKDYAQRGLEFQRFVNALY